METYDVYEEYPELKNLKPRSPTTSRQRRKNRKRKRTAGNGAKLASLLLIIACVALIMIVLPMTLSPNRIAVYSDEGRVEFIKPSELEEYLADGWYANAADIVPMTFYAEDGSTINAVAGDAEKLAEKGWYADKSAAFTVMYAEDGKTLYVPNTKTEDYKQNGWTSNLNSIMKTLYKSDGSMLYVLKADADKYLADGWSDRILDVAQKMVKDDGEEEFVFNDDVDSYLANGWTVVKRVIDPSQPMLAITFDDGPGQYTDRLLDCLEQYNSVATFFTLGYLDEAYPDVVKREAELGCEVANHTWDHTSLTTLSAAKAAETIERTNETVFNIVGKTPALYRPPYGSYNSTVLGAINMPAIMWSIDTLDWKTKNADSTYNTIMQKSYDGAIILMHDIHEPTVEAACRVIPDLIEAGYQLVTVSELLEYRCGGGEAGTVYFDVTPEEE